MRGRPSLAALLVLGLAAAHLPAASAQRAAPTLVIFEVTDLVTGARSPSPTGSFVVEVHPEWAPIGAARFLGLVEASFFDGAAFFRVIPNFMAQFGLAADPVATAHWGAHLADDPVVQSNTRGMISFATAGPGTRTTQVFINFKDNSRLDHDGFAPFARVVDDPAHRGMQVVDRFFSGYGE